MKITINEALNRIKLIEKRLRDLRGKIVLVAPEQNGRLQGTALDKQQFAREAEANYAKYRALVANYLTLKFAVIKSNAETKVRIGDRELSVAEVIAYRGNALELEQALYNQVASNLAQVTMHVTRVRDALLPKAEAAAQAMVGGDKGLNPDAFQGAVEQYLKSNEARIYDPIGVEKMVRELEARITSFQKEVVDPILATSNATTVIEVDLVGE